MQSGGGRAGAGAGAGAVVEGVMARGRYLARGKEASAGILAGNCLIDWLPRGGGVV